MRNLINIVEGRIDGSYTESGTLWHGTDILSLICILDSNVLTRSIDTPDPAGASLTYDQRMAWSFADRAADIFDSIHGFKHDPTWTLGNVPTTGAVLAFDADKLRQQHKLILYHDDPLDDEKEVRVLGDQISPLSSYLTGFSFVQAEAEWFLGYLRSPFGKEWGWMDPTEAAKLLTGMMMNPLFQPQS